MFTFLLQHLELTSEAAGEDYHTVHSGNTLSWSTNWYDVPLSDLMSAASVIRSGQKLLLLGVVFVTVMLTLSLTRSLPDDRSGWAAHLVQYRRSG